MNIFNDYQCLSKKISEMRLDLEETLTPLEIMILVLEDRRYFYHPGFDILSIVRAFFVNLCGGHGGGASTIEQQLVRTITGRREKSLKRKLRELLLARKLRQDFSKFEILRAYEHIAYFGEGLVGVHLASNRLFEKPVSNLDSSELAKLASCLVSPIPAKINDRWRARVDRRGKYAISICKSLAGGRTAFGYRVGFHGMRPYFLSEFLAQSVDDLRS